MGDRQQGLIDKYRVQRTDGKAVAWCFVLEDKDPLAIPALRAYADAAAQAGYGPLAVDLYAKATVLDRIHNAYDPHRCGKPDLDRREPSREQRPRSEDA